MCEKIIVHTIDKIWRDPQNYCIIEFIRDTLFCYFKCWKFNEIVFSNHVKEENFIGVFCVENLLSIKHTRHTKFSLYPNDIQHDYGCYYYEIENSKWVYNILTERAYSDPEWKKYDNNDYRHFVFENAKYWIEVIGTEVSFCKTKKSKEKTYLWKKFG